MKTFNHYRQILVSVSFIFALANVGMSQTVERVKPEEFIIFPWGGMPLNQVESGAWGDLADADAMIKDLYDCGLNATGFIPSNYLEYAVKHHLAAIIAGDIHTGESTTQPQADAAIKKVMDGIPKHLRKAVYAFYVRDEPNASLFPVLRIWSEAIKKQGVMPYINLFPDYASAIQLGSKDYEEHLDKFVQTCEPAYISYDNYSLFEGGELNEDRFFSNLESVRKKSQQYEIPFWNVILGNMHFQYAEPSDATFNIQVYATLAYGGKGIGYFTFYTPNVGNYRLAPIDRFGYRTKTWDMMRNINLQIHTLAPIYCKLKNINVFHTGNIPKGAQGIDAAVLVKSVSPNLEKGLLVGEFVDADNHPYVMVVNKHLHSSFSVDVSFKKEGKVMMINAYTGQKVPCDGEQHWLAPGAGALLTVSNE
jgi:hypothetical protein